MTAISLLAGIMVAALILYVLLGGADFGAGLWDLLSSGPSKEAQKDLIASAIQPIWEANHVWLILIFVLLFSAFPPAFGTIMIGLCVPILFVVLGIVLRGSSFVFRAYATANSSMQRTCAYVFSMSSCFTPFFAGLVLGSLSDDHVVVDQDVSLYGYLFSWLNPFSICVGLLTLALFATIAATYLTVEAQTDELQRSFRHRAMLAGAITSLLAIVAFVLAGTYAHGLQEGLSHRSLSHGAELVTGIAFLAWLGALVLGRYAFARISVAAYASAMVVGWASAQYPYLVRPDRTIFNSVVAVNVLHDIVIAIFLGAFVLFPSLGFLLYVFKDHKSRFLASVENRQ